MSADDHHPNQTPAVRGLPAERPCRPYRLKRKEGAADGIRRIAAGRAEKALEELAEVGEDGDLAASIHRARKDLKKLRAVARLVRDGLGEKAFRAEDRRYRDAGRLLSSSRDAEVKLQTLIGLGKRFGEEFPAAASRGWEVALEADRDRLAEANGGEAAGGIERARKEIERGRERISHWPLRADSWELVSAGLDRSYRQGRKRMRETIAGPTSRAFTSGANASRTSGISCGSCKGPGRRCSARPPTGRTSWPTCSATTTISPFCGRTWPGAGGWAGPTCSRP